MIDPQRLAAAGRGLGPRDTQFLERAYAGGTEKYLSRLSAVGLVGLEHVLDAGCGFGQWSLALARLCGRVTAVDDDPARVGAAIAMAEGTPHRSVRRGSIEALPFPDATFDGVFCYSVIYYADVRRALRELSRVLKPLGALYVCSNGVGWYLYNIVARPNRTQDFDPRTYGLNALWTSTQYRALGIPPRNGASVATSRRWLSHLIRRNGLEILGVGPEGSIHVNGREAPEPFFRDRYWGLECVSEWLARKPSAA